MLGMNGKTVETALRIVFTIALIINALLIYPIRAEINNLADCVEAIERVDLPLIRQDIAETQAQLREQRIRNEVIEKSLDEIKAHLEHIRRKIGE
jgi:septal ring factor EnvC (AmiA/AmiB activator)